MSDIVFMDTETLGLDPDAPIWEFAAIRRYAGGVRASQHIQFQIHHDPDGWLDDFPAEFAQDYHSRFDETLAFCEAAASRAIADIVKDAHIIGAVPSFDTERLAKLLRRNGIEPGWHYHLVDVENVVVGYLRGLYRADGQDMPIDPPWKSDELSTAVGVDPNDFARHTAMGDVLWTMAQWDAVMA